MAEYIEREAVVNSFLSHVALFVYGSKTVKAILSRINTIPAADVVEVVRCKDCKYWMNGYCMGVPLVGDDASYVATEETDYCSYGEAKVNGKGDDK